MFWRGPCSAMEIYFVTHVISYIGLGSNLADPIQQINTAIHELSKLPSSRLLAQSSLYRSPPFGPQDQPDYINAVVALETQLAAEELLDELQLLEQLHLRERKIHWGPRTLDLDILLYGQAVINTERLQVPHPGVTQRITVLQPLAEIAPFLTLPDGGLLIDFIPQLSEKTIEQL